MRTEIIPFEPDAASTAEGKSRSYCARSSVYSFFIGPFLRFFVFKTVFGMEIILNGQAKQIAAHYTVGQLVSELFSVPAKGIAVAINQSIVPKSDWPTRQLSPNDQITLITATQGG